MIKKALKYAIFLFITIAICFPKVADADDSLKYNLPIWATEFNIELEAKNGSELVDSSYLEFFDSSGYESVLLKNSEGDVLDVDVYRYPEENVQPTGFMCYELEKDMYATQKVILERDAINRTSIQYVEGDKLYMTNFSGASVYCIRYTGVISLDSDYLDYMNIEIDQKMEEEKNEYFAGNQTLEEFSGNIELIIEETEKSMEEEYQRLIERADSSFSLMLTDEYGRSAETLLYLSEDMIEERQFEAAQIMLEKALKMDEIIESFSEYGRNRALEKLEDVYWDYWDYNGSVDRVLKLYWSEIKKFPKNYMNYFHLGGIYALKGNEKQTLLKLRQALQMHDIEYEENISWTNYSRYFGDENYKDLMQELAPYRVWDEYINGTAVATDYNQNFLHISEETHEPMYTERFIDVEPFFDGVALVAEIADKNYRYFFIDSNGKNAFDEYYGKAESFDGNGWAYVNQERVWYQMNINGEKFELKTE